MGLQHYGVRTWVFASYYCAGLHDARPALAAGCAAGAAAPSTAGGCTAGLVPQQHCRACARGRAAQLGPVLNNTSGAVRTLRVSAWQPPLPPQACGAPPCVRRAGVTAP